MSESDSNGFKITGQLFSRRDKIKSSPDYYKEKLARDKDKGTEVFSWIWFVLIPLIVVALPFQPSYNSLLTFLNGSATALGAVLGILLTIGLVFTQVHIDRYGSKIYTYLLSKRKIPLTIIMMLFSVAKPLVTITFLTSESSQTALNFYLFINIYNLLAGLSLAVFFPYSLLDIFKTSRYADWLYYRTINAIKTGERSEVEENIHLLIGLVESGIENRNRDAVKEGIESLHDILKYGLNNPDQIFDLSRATQNEGGLLGNRSDWFIDEIVSSFESFFSSFIDNNQKNLAIFVSNATSSCAVETLTLENASKKRERLAESYHHMMEKTSDQRRSGRYNIRFRTFIKNSLQIERDQFKLLENDFLDRVFLERILEDNPHYATFVVSSQSFMIAGKTFDSANKYTEKADIVVNGFVRILKINEDIGDPLEERRKSILKDYALLLSVFISGIDKSKAKECKEILDNYIDLEELVGGFSDLDKKLEGDFQLQSWMDKMFRSENEDGDLVRDEEKFRRNLDLFKEL